jgi:putative phosphoesterase
MRIGIVSDIHCNIAGQERALALMGDVDELICAGDSIYQYRFSTDVVRLLRERGAHTIQGNHEEVFLGRDGERARAAASVDQRELAWLAERPLELRTRLNGKTLAVVHGSPWEPHKEYLYPYSPTLARFQDFDADIVILGHTHYQMAKRVGRTLLINPGSAGESRDSRNGFQLSYAVLDTETEAATFGDYPDPTRIVAASSGEVARWNAAQDASGEPPRPGPDPWRSSLGT